MRWPALLLMGLLAAGCFGSDGPDWAAEEEAVHAAAVNVLLQEHPGELGHADAALHNASYNIVEVGYHNGVDASGDPGSIPGDTIYTELAVRGGYAYLNRFSASGAVGGFVIIDATDPENPTLVGEWDGHNGVDIEVDDAQDYAFVATQRTTAEQAQANAGASLGAGLLAMRGIAIVDVSDKTAPQLASFHPLPYNGPHTLTYHRHANGSEYLVVCTYDLYANTVTSTSAPATFPLTGAFPISQRLIAYRIEHQADVPALVQVGQYQVLDQAPPGKMYFPHDATFEQREVDGANRTLMHVAYWDKGVRILDFTDPEANPAIPELGAHTEFSPSALNNIHLARAYDAPVDGMRIVVAEPEIPEAADETGQFTFLDATDPGNVRRLGHWSLPADLGIQGFDFSPHNFDTFDGKIVLAHFHGGIWVVQAGDEDTLREPRSVGFYMPAKPRPDSPTPQPNVWTALEDGGLIYATDEPTGLHILRYTGP